MRFRSLRFVALAAAVFSLALSSRGADAPSPARKTENLIVVSIDGLRWQEVFDGADLVFIEHRLGGVHRPAELKERFFRDTTEARRVALMPFFWSVIAKQGQVFGDVGANCDCKVTNGRNISYPGYAEMFCGFPEPLIFTNVNRPNPNLTVFEFLNAQPSLKGRVSAYATWSYFPLILNAARGKFPVVSGWDLLQADGLTEREKQLNQLIAELPRLSRDNVYDSITAQAALEHLERTKPRVFYIGFGESDEWAHARRYDCYLEAANHNDRFLQTLWEKLQSTEQYAGKTTLMIVADHGRGGTLADWVEHKPTTPGAERIWLAMLGPDTPAMGVRSNVSVTQSQVAATMAAFLGLDFRAAAPRAAAPLPDVNVTTMPLPRSRQVERAGSAAGQ